ncbi:MAG: glycoside hydrolase family 97 N-terminal domain-containing protein, partial [Duncaniella sp.]|nr:glycoside hydrolase family 97 N-terminal domain-containing protein [Duncaniella sp.]
MRRALSFLSLAAVAALCGAEPLTVAGPDGRLVVTFDLDGGKPYYSVAYDGKTMLDPSPLGFDSNIGDFTSGLTVAKTGEDKISSAYTLNRSKVSNVEY